MENNAIMNNEVIETTDEYQNPDRAEKDGC